MNDKERKRIVALSEFPKIENIQSKFNGAVYLVKHLDLTRQIIGAADTELEAKIDAQNTRTKIINTAKEI